MKALKHNRKILLAASHAYYSATKVSRVVDEDKEYNGARERIGTALEKVDRQAVRDAAIELCVDLWSSCSKCDFKDVLCKAGLAEFASVCTRKMEARDGGKIA